MQRSAPSSFAALQRPAVDLYIRSASDLQVESQIVTLEYLTPAGGGDKVFRGKVGFLHRPSRVIGLEWSGSTVTSLVSSSTLYSKSSRPVDLFGSLHCGTRYEDFYLEVSPEVDDQGTSLVALSDVGGKQYATFAITYECDPLLETISDLLESPDYRPVGVDVLVKSGPLVFFDAIVIQFSAKKGTRTTLTSAKTAILDYLQSAGHPDTFRVTAIHDIMRQAGAARVVKVSVVTTCRPTPADRIMRSTLVAPGFGSIAAAWGDLSDPTLAIPNDTVDGVVPSVITDAAFPAGGPVDVWSATDRTVRFSTDPDNIQFVEI